MKSLGFVLVILMSLNIHAGEVTSFNKIKSLSAGETIHFMVRNFFIADKGSCEKDRSGNKVLPCRINGKLRLTAATAGAQYRITIGTDGLLSSMKRIQ